MDFVCFLCPSASFIFTGKERAVMAELTREEQAKAAQRAYMRKYSQRPEVRERKRQANIDFWARRYAEMTEMEKREAEKTR